MGRKEKMNHVKVVEQLHTIFHSDRPVVQNNNLEIDSIIPLLHQEIFELNGHPEDGMTLEDYRAQEISDIQYFVYSLMESIGYKPQQRSIDDFLRRNGLAWQKQSKIVPDYDYEERYTQLKYLLRDTADKLFSDETKTSPAPIERMAPLAQKILNIAVALHTVLQRNSTEEMRDKGARNLLKHSIPGYDNPDNDYKTVAKEKGRAWKEAAKIPGGGNPGFFDREWGVYSGPKIEYGSLQRLTMETALAEALAATPVLEMQKETALR